VLCNATRVPVLKTLRFEPNIKRRVASEISDAVQINVKNTFIPQRFLPKNLDQHQSWDTIALLV
jgi:hypothetical protein